MEKDAKDAKDNERKRKEALQMKSLHYAIENIKHYPVADKTEETIRMALDFYDYLILDIAITKKCFSGQAQENMPLNIDLNQMSLLPNEHNVQTQSTSGLEQEILEEIDSYTEGVNARWLAIARTDIQRGFMALRRALANKD